jgi:molybdate transport system substrate-binding protein
MTGDPTMRALALVLTLLAGPLAAETVTVFAAASLQTALDRVAGAFTAETGHQVVVSYAGSNVLAQQIIAGAPADIFLSASEPWMDEVAAAGLVLPGFRQDLLGNRLVLVAHSPDAPALDLAANPDLGGALAGGKLAMPFVDAVPAGQYGKEALENLGLWAAVEPHVVQTENVRAALALVARGEAPYGIVYATDAAAEPGVTVVGTFPADSHAPILYPVSLLTTAADAADRAFFDALSAPPAAAIFAEEGFLVP